MKKIMHYDKSCILVLAANNLAETTALLIASPQNISIKNNHPREAKKYVSAMIVPERCSLNYARMNNAVEQNLLFHPY